MSELLPGERSSPMDDLSVLLEEVALAMDLGSDPAAWDESLRRSLETAAVAFHEAVSHANWRSLAGRFGRVCLFVSRSLVPDSAMWSNARSRYTTADPKLNRWGRFQQRIPVARLRSYSEALLDEVISTFIKWDPVIEWLESDPQSTSLSEWLGPMLRELTRVVASARRVEPRSVEDCVNTTVWNEVQKLRQGACRYSYEGDFAGWLKMAALYRCRVPRVEPSPPPPPPPPIIGQPDPDPYFFVEWAMRYQLVRTFFRGDTQAVADRLWASMLVEADVSVGPCAGLPKNNVTAVVRLRLRKRLAVLRFIRERAQSAPDLPGDESMLAVVGRQSDKLATLRHIAALGRASAGESLCWAILARLVVDLRQDVKSAITFVTTLQGPVEARDRLARAIKHGSSGRFGGGRDACEFFKSPCWYLKILREVQPVESAVEYLRPAEEEKNCLRRVWAEF